MTMNLNCGIDIPVIGFGSFMAPYDKEVTESAIRKAIKLGYRHFDTGAIYGSEPAVGKVINEEILNQTINREDVFITTKLWCSDHHDPVSALRRSLKNMDLEYMDMFLIHHPVKFKSSAFYLIPKPEDFEELDLEKTWSGMEKCVELGLCKGIGVSNFSTKKLKQLLEFASVPPAINQVEMHVLWKQQKLRDVCVEKKIHVSAYQALGAPNTLWGTNAVIENPVIKSIALKHSVKPAQVALKWVISKGSSVIVKSFSEERMKENLECMNLKLDDQDHSDIDNLQEKKMVQAHFLINPAMPQYSSPEQYWDYEC